MKNKILVLFFLFILSPAQGQVDTLNRLDVNGARYGWWVVYLDDNLSEVKDSTQATHYHYALYQGKFSYYNMGAIGSKKSPVIFPESDTLVRNGKILLDGTYQSNHKNGQAWFVLVVDQGVFVDYKEYYDNGNLKTHFEYTPACGTPYHYCIYMYNKDGSLKYKGTNQTPDDRKN